MHQCIFVSLQLLQSVYQLSDATATGIHGNQKVSCLGYTPRAGEVPSPTQRYGPVSLWQYVVRH